MAKKKKAVKKKIETKKVAKENEAVEILSDLFDSLSKHGRKYGHDYVAYVLFKFAADQLKTLNEAAYVEELSALLNEPERVMIHDVNGEGSIWTFEGANSNGLTVQINTAFLD